MSIRKTLKLGECLTNRSELCIMCVQEDDMEKRERYTVWISSRLTPTDGEKLQQVLKEHGVGISEYVRWVVHQDLALREKVKEEPDQ